jgi:hypothetical protein
MKMCCHLDCFCLLSLIAYSVVFSHPLHFHNHAPCDFYLLSWMKGWSIQGCSKASKTALYKFVNDGFQKYFQIACSCPRTVFWRKLCLSSSNLRYGSCPKNFWRYHT